MSRKTITESPLARVELVRRITSSNNTKTKIKTFRIIMMQNDHHDGDQNHLQENTRRMKIITQGVTKIMRVKMDMKMERVETAMVRTAMNRKTRRLTLAVAKI
jgi:hypothetical protein